MKKNLKRKKNKIESVPTVTSLKPQKNGKRVNVYLDDKFGFGIDLDNLVKFGIKTDKEFTSDELNKIIKEAEFHRSYEKLLRFSTTRPRSEWEIDMWFRRKKIPEVLIKNLKLKLKKLGFLNDEEFAKWWIGQRVQYRSKSKRELKYELQNKGIDRNLIDSLLSETEIDEEKLALNLLNRRHPKDPVAYLARHGFGWDIIKKLTGKGQEE